MNICLFTSVYALSETDPHGSFLVESTKHLVRQGHQVSIFAPAYEGLKSHTVHGVPVHRFRYFFKRWENLTHGEGAPHRIRNPLYLFIALFYIIVGLISAVRFCRQHRFDIIHVHWPFPHGIWGFAAGKLAGVPTVLTFHGAEILLSKKFPFVQYFLQHAIRHARAVICNSTYTRDEVARLTDREIDVIPFGCTIHNRNPIKRVEKKTKEILFVGRLIRRKGLDYLIKALPLIEQKVPVHLHVVGSGGTMGSQWKALTHEMKLDAKVTFHGVVSHTALEERYASADLFVLPAIVDDRGDTEGLGVVLVEALSFKVPVVASAVGGIKDVIIGDRTGLLVPQKDSEALARAAVQLLTDPFLADRLAEQGRAHARDYFDWDRITNQLIDVYQRATSAPS